MKTVVTVKLSRNPIPFEYGFNSPAQAKRFHKNYNHLLLRWITIENKTEFEYPNSGQTSIIER